MKLELLSPAKDFECGVAAILHGADAVYIGAPKFSARAAAGNSLDDIKKLVDFAHQYYVRVYVALNTILNDDELAETQQLINELYAIGVDALIIQDMGILELDLPPIELHASTQCDNRTAEKVKFLEKCGFTQAILARELSLEQIAEIRRQTNIRLECFVYGALCVSYSGQCFMSQAINNRSANRGECAQMCRLSYDLVDNDEKIIAQNQHLLSLKDFDVSKYLEKMVEIGVTSFKIEGRLKNIDYVKNITAFYRQKLDEIIFRITQISQINTNNNSNNADNQQNIICEDLCNSCNLCSKSSSGKTKHFFTPDVERTFYRGATSYFLEKRQKNIIEFRTPKSLGKPIGEVKLFNTNNLVIDTKHQINNGDGLCAFDRNGDLVGFRVNRVEGNRIFPQTMPTIEKNAQIFRNFDIKFSQQLENKSSERRIEVKFSLKEEKNGINFSIIDEDNRSAEEFFETNFEPAQNPEKQRQAILENLSKLGDTIFEIRRHCGLDPQSPKKQEIPAFAGMTMGLDIEIDFKEMWFIPVSKIAQIRRTLVEKLLAERTKTYPKQEVVFQKTNHPFLAQDIDYRANIFNQKAADFYQRHGVKKFDFAFEHSPVEDVELMRTKHCLKFSFGFCPKQENKKQPNEPLYLVRGYHKFLLQFDCKNCEMLVLFPNPF